MTNWSKSAQVIRMRKKCSRQQRRRGTGLRGQGSGIRVMMTVRNVSPPPPIPWRPNGDVNRGAEMLVVSQLVERPVETCSAAFPYHLTSQVNKVKVRATYAAHRPKRRRRAWTRDGQISGPQCPSSRRMLPRRRCGLSLAYARREGSGNLGRAGVTVIEDLDQRRRRHDTRRLLEARPHCPNRACRKLRLVALREAP